MVFSPSIYRPALDSRIVRQLTHCAVHGQMSRMKGHYRSPKQTEKLPAMPSLMGV